MIVPFVRKGVCAATITGGTGDPRGYFFEQVQFFKGLVSTLNVFVQLSFALYGNISEWLQVIWTHAGRVCALGLVRIGA